MRIKIIKAGRTDEYGRSLVLGSLYDVGDALGASLVQQLYAVDITPSSVVVTPQATIASSGRSGQVWGNGSTAVMTRCVVPANTVVPGATLKIFGQLVKYVPFNGGHNFTVSFIQGANTVFVGATSITAVFQTFAFAQDLLLSNDRRWAWCRGMGVDSTFFNTSPLIVGQYSLENTLNAASMGKGARTASTAVAFATYAAPASSSAETVLIDFTKDFTIEVGVTIAPNDCLELTSFSVLQVAQPGSLSGLPAKATLFAGDSFFEGSGSTANNDCISVFGRLRPNRACLNLGLGAQTSAGILPRVLADPIASKYWDVVYECENDINVALADPAYWFSLFSASVDAIIERRPSGASKVMICNLLPNTAWSAAFQASMIGANQRIAAKYGNQVADVYSALATDNAIFPGYPQVAAINRADTLHLNDAGYAIYAGVMNTTATTLGWA